MRNPGSTAHGSAPGKVILLGEHAVVYHRPALVAAIDRHVEVCVTVRGDEAFGRPAEKGKRAAPAVPTQVLQRAAQLMGVDDHQLCVTTTAGVPVGVGLGSSAALSVALLRALRGLADVVADDTAICARAFELEKLFHGFPSGIDNTACTFGGLLRYQRGGRVCRLASARALPLVVALGRAPRETRGLVTALRRKWEADPAPHDALFDEIAVLVGAAQGAVAQGDLVELGVLMNANHALLYRLGVSTDELERMVALARAHGALGAKLTGGGGGGAVICLCPHDPARLVTAFAAGGWDAFITRIPGAQRGVHAIADDHVERRIARV